jgi:hypothetical protein
MLLRQLMPVAFSRAELSAGSRIAARIAMIAITTRSSINVNDDERGNILFDILHILSVAVAGFCHDFRNRFLLFFIFARII